MLNLSVPAGKETSLPAASMISARNDATHTSPVAPPTSKSWSLTVDPSPSPTTRCAIAVTVVPGNLSTRIGGGLPPPAPPPPSPPISNPYITSASPDWNNKHFRPFVPGTVATTALVGARTLNDRRWSSWCAQTFVSPNVPPGVANSTRSLVSANAGDMSVDDPRRLCLPAPAPARNLASKASSSVREGAEMQLIMHGAGRPWRPRR